jgi:hypothetical protein
LSSSPEKERWATPFCFLGGKNNPAWKKARRRKDKMAFTVSYASFQDGSGYWGGYTGGVTPPTQAQAALRNVVSTTLNFTDTDTTFTLTHNMGLTAAQLTCLFPLVTWVTIGSVQAVGTGIAPVLTITKAANTITVTKQQATGSGQTVQIDVRRPGTPGY